MQLGNAVVQFEEKLSSAGRNSASYSARGHWMHSGLPQLRGAQDVRTRLVHGEPETGSIAAGYPFNDIARAYIGLFAKIPTTALDANEWRRMAGQRSCAARRRSAIAHFRETMITFPCSRRNDR